MTVVLATNPFAIRYATEARVYGLVTLEVAFAVLAVVIGLEPGHERAGAIGLAVAEQDYHEEVRSPTAGTGRDAPTIRATS